MNDLDEDAPPELSKLADQISALKRQGISGSAPTGKATVTAKYTTQPKPASFKSGFLNKQNTKAGRSTSTEPKKRHESAVPHIKARQSSAVPDMFMLPPDEQQKQYAAMRNKLAEDLKPTEETISQIAGNKGLLAGFDDPEIMQAVNDVAQNPTRIEKYKNNRKVQAFYQQMGAVMAQRCDELSAAQEQRQGSQKPESKPSSTKISVQTKPLQSRKQQVCTIEEIA